MGGCNFGNCTGVEALPSRSLTRLEFLYYTCKSHPCKWSLLQLQLQATPMSNAGRSASGKLLEACFRTDLASGMHTGIGPSCALDVKQFCRLLL